MGSASKHYDIVIAGGGMIGTSLALASAPLGLKVAVVEAVARGSSQQPSFDERSTALSRSTQRMFEAMGLWDDIVAASTPITSIHVSDQGRFGFSHIDAAEQGVEALGYVVINRVLGAVLQQALDDAAGVDVICPARITGIDLGDDKATARVVRDGEEFSLHCDLLVAADGANSSVREMMGISASRSEYGQRAVIGNLLTEKPMDNRAYERFTSQGPLALLPVNEGRAAFIWTIAEDDADRVLALEDSDFLRELQAAFGNRQGELSNVGKRAAYPLVLSRAACLTSTRSVLIGNSAHGLHPVSAQGFNLGMRDVAALCDCLADFGINQNMLQHYAEWRQGDQRKLVRFTDSLVKLFGAERPPLKILRNAGMLGFDLIPGVRSMFAKHTMGLAGRLPRLSRGVPIK